MMRSIYMTHFYKQNNINYNDKKKLSHQMRHSVETASINYNKISQNTNIPDNCEKIISDLNNENYNLKKKDRIIRIK